MPDKEKIYIDDNLDYTGQSWIDKVLLHQTGKLEGIEEHPDDTLQKIFPTAIMSLYNVETLNLKLSQYSIIPFQYKWYPDTEEQFNLHLEDRYREYYTNIIS